MKLGIALRGTDSRKLPADVWRTIADQGCDWSPEISKVLDG
jgi:hypothetical protein